MSEVIEVAQVLCKLNYATNYATNYALSYANSVHLRPAMPTHRPAESDASPRLAALRRLLASGPLPGVELQAALNIDQTALSRTIQEAGASVVQFRLKGIRTPQYGMLRSLPKIGSTVPVYRIDEGGSVHEVAVALLLAGGQTLMRTTVAGKIEHELFAGLPPSMAFAAPSGFMGRALAREAAKVLDVPESINRWNDDHRVMYLATMASDTPGSYVFGNASLARLMEGRQYPLTMFPAHRSIYPQLARAAAAGAANPTGGELSSAGGEQPKFLCFPTEGETPREVIVKFARIGTRMGDLLHMERLALDALAAAGLPASHAASFDAGFTFLEVNRFDRVGRFGRRGVISAGAIDDELFGSRRSWSDFAARCLEAGVLDEVATDIIRTLDAFGELIGNNDRHMENLSLMLDSNGSPARVAPAYDMLPMRYATQAGSLVDPELTPVTPKLGDIGGRSAVWAVAGAAAQAFWRAVAAAPEISNEMRELAAQNVLVVAEFVAPLVDTMRVGDDTSQGSVDRANFNIPRQT